MALNPRQRAFVAHYIKTKNATESAKAAGYSKKTAHSQGPRLLENDEVQKAIKQKLEPKLKKLDLSAERVLEEIGSLAFKDGGELFIKGMLGAKTKCLEMLAKYNKLLTEKVEHSGSIAAPMIVLTMPANGSEAKEDK